LKALGYRVCLGDSVTARQGYLAGSEALRRSDLLRMFAAPDIRAVLCARGGYGVTRLLPSLDLADLARHPKIFVGYSDVSPLLIGLVQRGGLVAFHGPMVAADFGSAAEECDGRPDNGARVEPGLDDRSRRQLLDIVGDGLGVEVEVPTVVRPGSASGVLIGGCLSLLAAMVGTPYALRGEGAILFIEDIAEPSYRIDRMLTQLHQAGAFEGVRGVVFGAMTRCGPGGGAEGLLPVLAECADRLKVPVGAGLPSGHGRPNLTLPFGVDAELVLEANPAYLRVRGPAVA
jgi:muramoyltetrapeptide carboxypeptidase